MEIKKEFGKFLPMSSQSLHMRLNEIEKKDADAKKKFDGQLEDIKNSVNISQKQNEDRLNETADSLILSVMQVSEEVRKLEPCFDGIDKAQTAFQKETLVKFAEVQDGITDIRNNNAELLEKHFANLDPSVKKITEGVNEMMPSVKQITDNMNGLIPSVKKINEGMNAFRTPLDEVNQHLIYLKNMIEFFEKRFDRIEKTLDIVSQRMEDNRRIAMETNWAEIFNSTINGTEWLKAKSFSPGRWAIGYQVFYVLYRVLNDLHPKRILDLGLGQSSWMIAQYAATDESVKHTIVEHDDSWIDFFSLDHNMPDNCKIVQLDLDFTDYQGVMVREYGGFSETFSGQKFDLILVDGPLGGDMKDYSRIDVLKMLPGILADDFIIMFDDAQRPGEKKTIQEMKKVLDNNGIEYASGTYSGTKDMTVICSKSLYFITTM